MGKAVEEIARETEISPQPCALSLRRGKPRHRLSSGAVNSALTSKEVRFCGSVLSQLLMSTGHQFTSAKPPQGGKRLAREKIKDKRKCAKPSKMLGFVLIKCFLPCKKLP